jgi:hypothetical protein
MFINPNPVSSQQRDNILESVPNLTSPHLHCHLLGPQQSQTCCPALTRQGPELHVSVPLLQLLALPLIWAANNNLMLKYSNISSDMKFKLY